MYNYFVFFVFGKLWIYIPNLVKNQVDFWSQSVKSEGFFFLVFFGSVSSVSLPQPPANWNWSMIKVQLYCAHPDDRNWRKNT